MLRHVIADPKDTFSVTGGSEVSNYGDGESRRAIGHSTRPHVVECSSACDPPAPESGSGSNHVFNNTLVLLFLEATTINVSL